MNRPGSIFVLLLLAGVFPIFGCADRIFLGQTPRYPVDSVAGFDARLQPYQRHHIETPAGRIELWYWDMRGREPSDWLDPDRRPNPPALPEIIVFLTPGGAMLVQSACELIEPLYGGQNVGVVGWNFPGHGSSSSASTLRAVLDAALATFDHVQARCGDRPLVLHGLAMGCGPTLYIASKRTVAGVVLDGPVRANVVRYASRHGWWNLWTVPMVVSTQVPAEYDVAETARLSINDCPLLVVHGDADDLVPVQHGLDAYNRWPYTHKRLLILPEVGHYPATIRQGRADYVAAVRRLLADVRGFAAAR